MTFHTITEDHAAMHLECSAHLLAHESPQRMSSVTQGWRIRNLAPRWVAGRHGGAHIIHLRNNLHSATICTPQQFRGKNFPNSSPSGVSKTRGVVLRSNFAFCGAGRIKDGPRDVMRAVVRTTAAVEECVADAKRAIDEVLTRGGGDGGLAQATWALYADTKRLLADAVTKLGACRGRDFGAFLRSADAHGVWEVFYAPHMFAPRVTSAVGTPWERGEQWPFLLLLGGCWA